MKAAANPPRPASGAVKAAAKPRRPAWARAARVGAWILAGAAALAVLLVFVFPTRTYLDQRRQLAAATQRLRVLNAADAQLAAEADQLQSNTEIERLARERYHLVRPGEQAFAILPAPATPPAPAPPAKPAHRAGFWQRVTGWM